MHYTISLLANKDSSYKTAYSSSNNNNVEPTRHHDNIRPISSRPGPFIGVVNRSCQRKGISTNFYQLQPRRLNCLKRQYMWNTGLYLCRLCCNLPQLCLLGKLAIEGLNSSLTTGDLKVSINRVESAQIPTSLG